ncbi:hypothetical protein SAMN06272755_1511 [Picosynechococcus sp. OG1]|nr:hypothetical protein SAMN06272755_1511 [Picosynechococcus sp. OG1]SMQ79803.1 hypothetical protein SAMN06272774_0791 [Synechococcus sp. 7002]
MKNYDIIRKLSLIYESGQRYKVQSQLFRLRR